MNGRMLTLRWPVALLAAILLAGGGALIAILLSRAPAGDAPESERAAPAPATAGPAPSAVAADAVVTLTPEMAARAGIEVVTVATVTKSGGVRFPGIVQPNAYKEVVVTPIVTGRVTRVQAELGAHVKRGQTLAQVFSPELSQAQTELIGLRAELEAAHHRLERTRRLVEIGAASRQELEQVQAEHTHHATLVESAKARLVLLGVPRERLDRLASPSQVTATVNVPAPIAGVVTTRDANVGLNVEASTPLFTVVDLSTVWIVGDLYERDFAAVRVGSPATVATDAYPGLALEGRVSYIDPQLKEETRTARLRVEVPNRGGRLRLGMYVDVAVAGAGAGQALAVPRSAIQTIGNRHVVYLASAGQPARFVEREVQPGAMSGDRIEIVAGLSAGDRVVGKGAFFLRAERERISPAGAAGEGPRVEVTEQGFVPSSVTVPAGQPVRLTFIRRVENTCATAVRVPDEKIARDLPLNTPVVVEFTPKKREVTFTCGMDMYKGQILVR